MSDRTFVLCGHRGSMADAPENTLSSFAKAERVGANEIEFDVRATRDGVLVVIHDRTVERTAAAATPHLRTPIEYLTFDELRTVDLGAGEQVPTFEEVLDATSVLLQVEIKAPSAARLMGKLLRDRPTRDQERCLVTTFEPLSMHDFTQEWPDAPRGIALHVPDVESNWREDAQRLGASTIFIPMAIVKKSHVDELHDAGYRVGASLLDGPGDVRRILELDVDTSASNAPEYARQLLEASDEFMARYPDFARTTTD